jgi:hypothetical protein
VLAYIFPPLNKIWAECAELPCITCPIAVHIIQFKAKEGNRFRAENVANSALDIGNENINETCLIEIGEMWYT